MGVGNGSRVEFSRAALAGWVRRLDASANVSDSGAPSSIANEAMLDWLVVYVRCGWTPMEVPFWLFPTFGDLLFEMVLDSVEEG